MEIIQRGMVIIFQSKSTRKFSIPFYQTFHENLYFLQFIIVNVNLLSQEIVDHFRPTDANCQGKQFIIITHKKVQTCAFCGQILLSCHTQLTKVNIVS